MQWKKYAAKLLMEANNMTKLESFQIFSPYFKIKPRDNGEEFSYLVDEAPESLRDFIHSVHKDYFYDCFPNDWIYGTIHDAFCDLETHDLESFTIEADCYYHDLNKWHQNPFAQCYCEEAVEEGLVTEASVYPIISAGQWLAKQCIYNAVNEFIKHARN